MWLQDVPDVDEELRQGDLIVGIPFPRPGSVRLTEDGLTAPVDLNVSAVVLDHCCTIEQKHVVLLARVTSREPDDRMMAALTNLDPSPGRSYSRYLHLLEPHAALPVRRGKRKVINLLDRVQLLGSDAEAFLWLRERRSARMDVVSRAHLRLKLAVHFGRVEEEGDLPLLQERGLDSFGRPTPAVYGGIPSS